MRPNIELIQKYLSGHCTPEEKADVETWLEDSNSADTDPTRMDEGILQEDMAAIHANLKAHIAPTHAATENTSGSNASHRRLPWLKYSAAASILLVCICAVLYIIKRPPDQHWQAISNTNTIAKEVVLADGSKIILYPTASIEVLADSANRRIKLLTGKAYFAIAHAASTPMTIELDRSTVDVLGTTFTINRTQSEDKIRLHSGRIGFTAPGKPMQLLAAGQEISYNNTTGKLQFMQDTPPQSHPIALRFSDTNLTAVFAKLEEKFGVTIKVVDPSINTLRYTGNLEKKSLDDIETILSLSADIRFKSSGNIIIVTKQ